MVAIASCRSQLEQFSNELLLDIFEYLDGYDLCQAFYGLNYRINTLLKSVQLHIVLKSEKNDPTIWQTLSTCMSPLQVRALSIYEDMDVETIVPWSCNENVCSLRLTDVSPEYLNQICERLPVDNRLKSFQINQKTKYFDSNVHHAMINALLVTYGDRFRSLANLAIQRITILDFPSVSMKFLSLRHLILDSQFYDVKLFPFLNENTPNLRSLKLSGMYQVTAMPVVPVKHIRELHLEGIGEMVISSNFFEYFPNIRRLHMNWAYSSRQNLLFNGKQWQRIIETYLPHLKQWTIVFSDGVSQDITQSFYIGDFWLSKKVNVKSIINKAQSRYRLIRSIYFGKQWSFAYISDRDF